MDFKEMEKLAYQNAPLPRGLNALDQAAYLSLRCLYSHYRRGGVTKADAEIEKRAIKSTHEARKAQDAFAQQCRQKSVELWRDIEGPASDYRKDRRLETADKLMEIIYGIEMPKQIKSGQE